MKILLDHCVPRRLARAIKSHQVLTTREMKWELLRNGMLLRAAADAGFEAFITTDRNLRFQQNLSSLPLSVTVLISRSNSPEHLMPLAPLVTTTLEKIVPRTLIEIGSIGKQES